MSFLKNIFRAKKNKSTLLDEMMEQPLTPEDIGESVAKIQEMKDRIEKGDIPDIKIGSFVATFDKNGNRTDFRYLTDEEQIDNEVY